VSAIRGLLHRVRVLMNPDAYAREVEREIRLHLDLEAMQRRGAGLDEINAYVAARRQFGNVTGTREEVRRMSGIEWLDRIRQNFAYAVRGLAQAPGFTVAVVLTLGLGLGVNAAMFTFIDRVFVKPPAGVVKPDAVRRMYSALSRPNEPNGRLIMSSIWYAQLREIRRQVDSGVAIGLFRSAQDSFSVAVGTSTHPARRTIANSDYFRVLGVRPHLGRLFDAEENRIEVGAPVAVLSHAMWRRVFGGDQHAIGSTMRIQYRDITIIGVTPEGFSGIDLDRSDFWMPIGNAGSGMRNEVPWFDSYEGDFAVLTRFDNAASEQRFVDIASRVARPIRAKYFSDSTVAILSGPINVARGPVQRAKEVTISVRLIGVAVIVLLIAVANVSNLLLVRATRREREIAIRRALGVSRARLAEQLLAESVLLALIGGAVALVFAVWAGAALRGLLLPSVNWSSGALDVRAALFAGGAALLVGIVAGLVPVVHAWRPDLTVSLRAGSKNASYRRSGLRAVLLVVQAALSIVLLVGSGVFVRSLRHVQAIGLGIDVERTITIEAYADTGDLRPVMAEAMPAILDRLARIPGVQGVAAASAGPMQGASYIGLFLPGHDSLPMVGNERSPALKRVTFGYFHAVGQRLVAGRDFTGEDPPSVIVGESMAKAYWPGESAVGKCLIPGKRTGPCVPVIGVAEDTHHRRILDDRQLGRYYVNFDAGRLVGVNSPIENTAAVVRAEPEAHAAITRMARVEIQRIGPRAAFVSVRSMMDVLANELRPWRLGATLFTVMGGLALIVAAVGVYSVIAYATSQRAREMGIRIALGAQLADIAKLVMGEGLRTVVIGIVVGIALSIAAGKLVASLLYGISPRDPGVMLGAALVLAAVGIAASVIPALKAARIDPISSLRVD
jgi:putative ABC transport system permease protein